MKKYLRLILEILMGLLLAGAVTVAYWSYSGKSHVMGELTEASEGMEEAQQELDKTAKELKEAQEKVAEYEPAAKQMAAMKEAFSNGVVLQDYEAFIKAQKKPHHQRAPTRFGRFTVDDERTRRSRYRQRI